MRLIALFGLAFAPAPPVTLLNLATESNSPAHSSIGTPSPDRNRMAPTACKHAVSGSISLPSRGAFHLSLTVLVHYRSSEVFSLGEWSPQLPTGFLVSRGTQVLRAKSRQLSPTGLSPSLAGRSRAVRLDVRFVTARELCSAPAGPTTPLRKAAALRARFGLFPVRSPLLGESFLFLGVLRCFSSPGSLYRPMCSVRSDPASPGGLPHSEISGSSLLGSSPGLIAALPRPSSASDAKASTARP